jgi:hypothetical protein
MFSILAIILALASAPTPAYHYSVCQGQALRVYEGACGAETGLRYGVPVGAYLWTDAAIDDLCGTTFVALSGCTLTARWAPGWRPAAHLVTTYDSAARTWSLPEVIELRRVFLPLVVAR